MYPRGHPTCMLSERTPERANLTPPASPRRLMSQVGKRAAHTHRGGRAARVSAGRPKVAHLCAPA
eukprot:3268131-Prymnesium_polylepis.1